MKKCEVCTTDNNDQNGICIACGFDLQTKQIHSTDKFNQYLGWLKKEKKWVEEVRIKRNVHSLQVKIHGRKAGYNNMREWTMGKTARIFGEDQGQISKEIYLATELDKHPDLLKCKNKSQALRMLSKIKGAIGFPISGSSITYEKDVHKYLEDFWESTSLSEEWELKESRYDTKKVGEIDILAHHREDPVWLVIELKRDQSSDDTVGQILRYMGWVMEKKARDGESVKGMIISESPDEYISYALKPVPAVSLMLFAFEGEKLLLCNLNDFRRKEFIKAWERLSEAERAEFLKDLPAKAKDVMRTQ